MYFERLSSDFNPRPREEGDFGAVVLDVRKVDISIHALVKRATTQITGKEICVCISIHALVKRATNSTLSILKAEANFNPRPREEGDLTISA